MIKVLPKKDKVSDVGVHSSYLIFRILCVPNGEVDFVGSRRKRIVVLDFEVSMFLVYLGLVISVVHSNTMFLTSGIGT